MPSSQHGSAQVGCLFIILYLGYLRQVSVARPGFWANDKAQQRRPAGHDTGETHKRAAVCCSRLFGVPYLPFLNLNTLL